LTAPSIRPPAPLGAGPARPVSRSRARPAAPVRPVLDPRLSARRIAVRRDEGRRRLRRLAWIGGALLAVAAALGSTRTPLLDLDHIEVAGDARVGDAEVLAAIAAAGIRPGRPLADLDLGQAEAALEQLPAVQDAEVVRHWPGGVEVRLTERRPVAVVGVAGGRAVIGADGTVIALEPLDRAPATPGLVLVDGPATLVVGDRFEAAELLDVAAAMPPSLVPLVAAVGAGEGSGAVDLRLAGGGVVHLGSAEQLAAKLLAAATVLHEVDGTCLDAIDVRVPSAPTVTRRAGC
jgi:cell division protein FtsQ